MALSVEDKKYLDSFQEDLSKLWSKTGFKAYEDAPDVRPFLDVTSPRKTSAAAEALGLTKGQLYACQQIKAIFNQWLDRINETTSTDASACNKLSNFRKYLATLLGIKHDKKCYKTHPYSWLNFPDNKRERVNVAYLKKHQDLGTNQGDSDRLARIFLPYDLLIETYSQAYKILKRTRRILDTTDATSIAIAIELFTGRRISEVLDTNSELYFDEDCGDDSFKFKGLKKGDEEKAEMTFIFPLAKPLIEAPNFQDLLLSRWENLQGWLLKKNLTLRAFDRPKAYALAEYENLKTYLRTYHKFDLAGKSHFFRKLYVAYHLHLNRPPEINEPYYIAEILGEGTFNDEGLHYDTTTAINYQQITIVHR